MLHKIREQLNPVRLKEFRDDIRDQNEKTNNRILIMCGLISLLGASLRCIAEGFWTAGPLIALFVFFLLVSCVHYFAIRPLVDNTTALLYVSETAVLLVMIIYDAMFTADTLPFLFLVGLIVLPCQIFDKPWRIFVFTIAMADLYLVVAAVFTKAHLLPLDFLRTMLSTVISLYMSYVISDEKISQLLRTDMAQMSAEHDKLTGVFNRTGGEELIQYYVQKNKSGTFIEMDVDNFKHINDDYGHAKGDEVLQKVALVLKGVFREMDIVMRAGGDEFIIYATGMVDYNRLSEKLDDVQAGMHTIMLDAERNDYVTVSMGAVINNGSYPTYQSLYETSDIMLYKTKSSGKNGFRIRNASYDPFWIEAEKNPKDNKK